MAIDVLRRVYTNNPPCGAMRGFGAVQAAFAYESQMDKLAAALGMDPVELRIRNAMREGSAMPTGQVVDSAAPVAELLRRLGRVPARCRPGLGRRRGRGPARRCPGGVSNTTHGEGVVRGVGYAVGIKNVGFSEGFDDYSTARVRLELVGGEPVAQVHTAAAEVGPGPGHHAEPRSPGPSSAWSAWSSCLPTPRSAAPVRPQRPGRPT